MHKKICSKCSIEKTEEDFYFYNKNKGLKRAECKTCHDLKKKIWTKENEDSLREKRKIYRAKKEVLERRNIHSKEWNKKNLESVLCTHARKRAKELNIPCTISKEDVVIPETCPALGIPLFYGDGKMTDNSPSLDRLEPSIGYVKGNVEVISVKANRIKNNASLEEIEKVFKWLKGKQNVSTQ
jgi:hypothetical protein